VTRAEAADGRNPASTDGQRRRRAPLTLFEPVRTRRTVENVIDQIVEKIKAGDLEHGAALPGERQLAAQMEVSRRTIREAVNALSTAGVLEVQPGSGGGMRISSIWVPTELTKGAIALSADEVFQILEARRTVEPRIAQLAAARATDEDFDAMRSAIELQRKVSGDPKKMTQADALFHRAMWRAARNDYLERTMVMIYQGLEVALDMSDRTPSDMNESLRLHEDTLAALVGADAGDVERAMDDHLSYLEGICEDVLGRPRHRRLPAFLRAG